MHSVTRVIADACSGRWCPSLLLCCLSAAVLPGCQRRDAAEHASASAKPAESVAVREREIWQFCSGCHQFPDPQNFSKREWRAEVAKGFGFHRDSGRIDLKPPPQEAVVAYFEKLAPESIEFPQDSQVSLDEIPGPVDFEVLRIRGQSSRPAAIARIEPFGDGSAAQLFTDMRNGKIWEFRSLTEPLRELWRVPHPSSVVRARLGSASQAGFVIADLGSFLPEDHHRGGLWWVADGANPTPQQLEAGLGRVSDVVAVDLDEDGDDDLVVSQFGWRRTGRLQVFWNDQPTGEWPHLRAVDIDPRHGCLRAEVCDFDGDGRLEIVAAFAQEHESIDIFRLRENLTFERFNLYRAPDPSWGTSDFAFADLDGDSLRDVVVCHGDSFDGGNLNPHHGVTWLRQTAPLQVVERQLAGMPGVHCAVPSDIDGDGDLDLALVSLLPNSILANLNRPRLASVVWLEQLTDLRFAPHVLEWDRCQHAACAVSDLDQDGEMDLIVGNFVWDGNSPVTATVFRNRGRCQPAGQ